jgi:hypothetical protein
MSDVDAHLVHFQCPNCGYGLAQTIGRLKAEKRLVCAGCDIGINFDTAKLAVATEALHAAVAPGLNEITIKFFR